MAHPTASQVMRQRESKRKSWAKRHAAMADPEFTIIAEVSQNWIDGVAQPLDGVPVFISQRFEHVIAVNAKRGYCLADWHLSRLVVSPNQINETIVAVFERRGRPKHAAKNESGP